MTRLVRRIEKAQVRKEMAGNGNGNGNWVAIGVIVSIVLAIGGAFISILNPRNDMESLKREFREDIESLRRQTRMDDARIEAEILRVKNYSSEKLLTKDEHQEFVRRTDLGIANARDEINRIRADQVTRAEHIQHWDEIKARIDTVRETGLQLRKDTFDSINSLQKEVGGQYTIGDQIKNLQDQLKAINDKMLMLGNNRPTIPHQ
jgi:hypothetical protein